MTITITVPSGYGLVLLEALVMGAQLVLIGFAAGSLRSKLFTKAFYEKNFPSWKKDGLPTESGYPDNGSGILSHKLSPSDWVTFNNAQRAHYNYLEGIIPCMMSLLVGGLYFPKYASILGGAYIFGRALYTGGYKMKGPKGRVVGAIICDLALVGLFGMAMYGTWGLAGGLEGIKNGLLN